MHTIGQDLVNMVIAERVTKIGVLLPESSPWKGDPSYSVFQKQTWKHFNAIS